jgi:SAM-dependent methyltransferase
MAEQGHRVHVGYHAWMLQDEVRNTALEAMIRALVRPGDVVADVGTGTGVLAALARRAGAARVYAIDASPIVTLVGRMARDNGLDGIIPVQGDAATVELPERVDVCFSECLGNFAFSDAMFAAVGAFANRWLAPDGRRGPVAVRLYLAPLDARLVFEPERTWTAPWRDLDLSAFLAAEYPRVRTGAAPPSFLRAPARQVLSFDPYDRADHYTLEASWSLEAERPVTALAGWFEVDWAPGVTMTTAPDAPGTHWSQTLFPLPPRTPGPDETLRVALSVDFDAAEVPHYRWEATYAGPEGMRARAALDEDRLFDPGGPRGVRRR